MQTAVKTKKYWSNCSSERRLILETLKLITEPSSSLQFLSAGSKLRELLFAGDFHPPPTSSDNALNILLKIQNGRPHEALQAFDLTTLRSMGLLLPSLS